MKLLWTISNWKRTGPVQPSLDLAAAVAAAGHDVRVEVGRPPRGDVPEAGAMRDRRGLKAAGVGARLHKHAFVLRDLPDVRRLVAWIRREHPDAIVTTLPNDHRLALRAARAAGGVPVVRLWFSEGPARLPSRESRALQEADHVVAFGEAPAARLRSLGLDEGRMTVLAPPLDVAGLQAVAAAGESRRKVPRDVFLFGVVARLQTHRRFELLWDAVAALAAGGHAFHVVVLGRGTWCEEVGYTPVRERGLADHVTFAGYLRGSEYVSTVAGFDAQLLLVPGSDPTCRALREGMALGVPSIATRRGLLPSIVADGETGILVEETTESLAAAMARCIEQPSAARELGAAAARRAESVFAADLVAEGLMSAVAAGMARATSTR